MVIYLYVYRVCFYECTIKFCVCCVNTRVGTNSVHSLLFKFALFIVDRRVCHVVVIRFFKKLSDPHGFKFKSTVSFPEILFQLLFTYPHVITVNMKSIYVSLRNFSCLTLLSSYF